MNKYENRARAFHSVLGAAKDVIETKVRGALDPKKKKKKKTPELVSQESKSKRVSDYASFNESDYERARRKKASLGRKERVKSAKIARDGGIFGRIPTRGEKRAKKSAPSMSREYQAQTERFKRGSKMKLAKHLAKKTGRKMLSIGVPGPEDLIDMLYQAAELRVRRKYDKKHGKGAYQKLMNKRQLEQRMREIQKYQKTT